jgi:Zn-dependent protease
VLGDVGLVLIVFVCVVLHEYGHALTAQRFGINTRDITLLPIGGVASLERMPEDPKQEFWITVAGPMVNLVIAGLAFVVIALSGVTLFFSDLLLGATSWTAVLSFIFVANLSLFLFNLIPAFPMDGGRILRSLLAMRWSRDAATRIAALVGRAFAIGFVVYGLTNGQPFLAFIGIFIFMAAGAEARSVRQQTLLRGIKVGEVMRTRFWSLAGTTTVQQAVEELLAGGDHVLLVMDGHRPLGSLGREDLLQAVQAEKGLAPLSSLPVRQLPVVAPQSGAQDSYQRLMLEGHPILPVVQDERVVGILEPENLAEYLQVMKAGTKRSA